jgi:Domain of unknown function (DUF4936)
VSARRVFVYYAVRASDAAAVLAALAAAHARLERRLPGLRCQRLRREDVRGDALTMMEVYEAAQGVDVAWQALIETEVRAALSSNTTGERHSEVFVEAASPACA